MKDIEYPSENQIKKVERLLVRATKHFGGAFEFELFETIDSFGHPAYTIYVMKVFSCIPAGGIFSKPLISFSYPNYKMKSFALDKLECLVIQRLELIVDIDQLCKSLGYQNELY